MKTTTLIQSIKKKLASATDTVTNEIAELRRRIEEKRRELKHARTAPVPREELEQRIRDYVHRVGEKWREDNGRILIGRLGAYSSRGAPRLNFHGGDLGSWPAFCAADPDGAADYMLAIVGRLEYEPGSASSERPAVLERLQAELAELEATEEALIDEAAAAGVNIEHRGEVIDRRQRERLDREAEAQRVRDREARQRAIDEAYARRRGSGRSRYLEANGPGPGPDAA